MDRREINISYVIKHLFRLSCKISSHAQVGITRKPGANFPEYPFDSLSAQLIGKMSVLIKDFTLIINDNDRCSNVSFNLMQMSFLKQEKIKHFLKIIICCFGTSATWNLKFICTRKIFFSLSGSWFMHQLFVAMCRGYLQIKLQGFMILNSSIQKSKSWIIFLFQRVSFNSKNIYPEETST